jgi:MFS family permease
MPVAAGELGGLRSYGLAFSLFLTTSLLGIVGAGGWSDRRGPGGPVVTGVLLFAGGLLVSGTATTFAALLVGRAVSGLGGGLLVVSLYVVVAQVYPTGLHPRVFGAISAAWVLPSVLGPPISGWLATEVTWRAVFLLVIPLALLPLPALVRGMRALPPPAATPDPKIRGRLVRGAALAVGAVLVQWGFQGAGPLPAVPVVLAGAAVLLAALPGLLPPGALRLARGLPSLVVVRAMFSGSYFGAETFVPLMLVTQRGMSPALAGTTLTAGALGWSAGSWLQGRGRLPLSRTSLLSVGGLVVGISVLLLVPAPFPAVPPWVVAPAWALGGFGMGLGMASTSVLTLNLSAPGEEGRNSSGLQIGDALGSVLGIGAAGAVFSVLHDPAGSDVEVFAVIWGLLGTVGVLSALVALRVRRPEPARAG